jgi:TetR/AcrR family fatty acid metabolism transcriptional regulator
MRTSNISKEQIIKAAAKVFITDGFENATVDDIAKEAKIAKGSVYTYFKSRDEILTESIKFVASERINTLQRLISNKKNAIEKLQILISANKKIAQKQPEIFLMNYALLLSSHENIKKKVASEFFKAYLNLVEKIIKEGIKRREFRDLDSKTMALMLVVTLDLNNILEFIDPSILDDKSIDNNLLKLIKKEK